MSIQYYSAVTYSKIFSVYKHMERHHNKTRDEAKLMRKKIKVIKKTELFVGKFSI